MIGLVIEATRKIESLAIGAVPSTSADPAACHLDPVAAGYQAHRPRHRSVADMALQDVAQLAHGCLISGCVQKSKTAGQAENHRAARRGRLNGRRSPWPRPPATPVRRGHARAPATLIPAGRCAARRPGPAPAGRPSSWTGRPSRTRPARAGRQGRRARRARPTAPRSARQAPRPTDGRPTTFNAGPPVGCVSPPLAGRAGWPSPLTGGRCRCRTAAGPAPRTRPGAIPAPPDRGAATGRAPSRRPPAAPCR